MCDRRGMREVKAKTEGFIYVYEPQVDEVTLGRVQCDSRAP
jgi:hypothetical protein